MLVQNRVSLALPVLPAAVQNAGINVKRGTSGVLLFVNLISPDDRYDTLYLSNFARIWVKNELSRLAGVGEVSLLSSHDYVMRAWLDPAKLAARNLSAADVAGAIAQQNLSVVPPIGEQPVPKGLQFRLTFDTPGRLASPEKIADMIVKSGDKGQVIRLRDIARVELGASQPRSLALLDGKPVATLVVRLTGEEAARKVTVAVRERLAALRDRFPEGLDYEANFDFAANLEGAGLPAASEYLLVDLDLPASTVERTARILKQSEKLLRQIPGVRHVLAFSENPFDPFGGPPCLLVLLNFAEQRKTAREEIIKTIRTNLGKIEEGSVRLRDLSAPGSFPRCGYPINLALHGPELARVREWSAKLAEKMKQSNKLADTWVNPASAARPGVSVEIDRKVAATLGVAVQDITRTIEVYSGPRPGNTGAGDWAKDLGNLHVRNVEGQMVPLSTLVKVRRVEAPAMLDFLDLQPMVEITANLEPGVSLDQARKICTLLADGLRKEMGLSAEYRLTWLR